MTVDTQEQATSEQSTRNVEDLKQFYHESPAVQTGSILRNGAKYSFERRRIQHTEAQETYNEAVRLSNYDFEELIISECTKSKDKLEGFDERLSAEFLAFEDTSFIFSANYEDVLSAWAECEATYQKRSNEIENLSTILESTEHRRSRVVSKELQRYTEILLEIEYVLPSAIERIVEKEAYKSNVVVLRNLQQYTSLIEKLLSANVDALRNARVLWEGGRRRWRQSYHNRQIDQLKTSLMSSDLLFSREMQQTLEIWRADVETIHSDNKLLALSEMRKDGAYLTVDKIQAVRTQMASFEVDENRLTERCFKSIRLIQDQQKRALTKHCENTRQALHQCTGIFHSTELSKCKQRLEVYLQDKTFAEFFQMAGDLRLVLDTVSNSLEDSKVISHAELLRLTDLLDVIANALTSLILEKDHENILQSVKCLLETLRENEGNDSMEDLLTLGTHLDSLQKLPDLHISSSRELSQIQNDLNFALGSNKVEETDNKLLAATLKNTPIHENATMDPKIIYDIRRRLSIFVYSSGLEEEFQKLLLYIRHQLLQQQRALELSNDAILPYETSILSTSEEDGKAIQTFIVATQTKNKAIQIGLERYICFIHDIAASKEAMQEDIEWVSSSVASLLRSTMEGNARDLQILENNFNKASLLLRHAPDACSLDRELQEVTDINTHFEDAYRSYDFRIKCVAPIQYQASQAILHRYLQFLVKHIRLVVEAGLEVENIEISASRSSLEKLFLPSEIEEMVARIQISSSSEADATEANSSQSDLINRRSQDDAEKTNFKQYLHRLRNFRDLDRTNAMSDLLRALLFESGTDQVPSERLQHFDGNTIITEDIASEVRSESAGDESNECVIFFKRNLDFRLPKKLLPDGVVLSMLEKYCEDISIQLDDFSNNVFQSIELAELERANECKILLDAMLNENCRRKAKAETEMYQTRIAELAKHQDHFENFMSRISKKLGELQKSFLATSHEIHDQFEKYRVLQLSLQTCLPLQTNLSSLKSVKVKYNKNAAAFKADTRKILDSFKQRNEKEVMRMDTMLRDYIDHCRKRAFQEDTITGIASDHDYHLHEINNLEIALVAFAKKVDTGFHQQRLFLLDTLEQTREEILSKSSNFEERYRAVYQNLELKGGLGLKFGHPKRNAQIKFWSEVHRTDRDVDDIDNLLQNTNTKLSLYLKSEQMESEGFVFISDTFRKMCILRSKFYYRGVYFHLLKCKVQLKPKSVHFLLLYPNEQYLMNAEVEMFNTVKFVDETSSIQDDDCMYPLNSSFSLLFEEVKANLVEETRKMYHDEGRSADLSEYPDGCPPSLNEYLSETQLKFQAVIRDRKAQYQQEINTFRNILELAIDAIFQIVLENSRAWMSNVEEVYTQQVQSTNDSLKSVDSVEIVHNADNQAVRTFYKVFLVFEHNVSAVSEAFLSLLDSCVLDEHDLVIAQDDPPIERKRKSLRKLQKLAQIAECGDKREVPHSLQELDLWKKAGESPRFSKRAISPIPESVPRQSLEKHIQPEQLDSILEGIDQEILKLPGVRDHGSRTSAILSTPLHRKVIKCRNESHFFFTAHASATIARLSSKFSRSSVQNQSSISTEFA